MAGEEITELSDRDLAALYIRDRGTNTAAARNIMERVVVKAGLDPKDFTDKPLMGRDGRLVTNEGEPAVVLDYLNGPAGPEATRGVLGFLMLDPASPDYESYQQAMASTFAERA